MRFLALCFASLLFCPVALGLRFALRAERETIEDLVQPEGYPVEHHFTTTEDGVVLSLHRIPHGRSSDAASKPAILLQHGLLDSAAAFLMNGRGGSLGFLLADAGFDVWFANSRRNTFSAYELQSKMDFDEFRDFCLDELVAYDLPASIAHVLNATGTERLSVVGHSQGTSVFQMWFSTHHPLVERIDMAFMLAPIVFVRHVTSPLFRALSEFEVFDLFKSSGTWRLMPNSKTAHLFMGPLCKRAGYGCADMISFLYGSNPSNLRPEGFDRYFTYVPAGSSEKLMIQWAQHIRMRNGTRFQKYDYGTRCWNWRRMRKGKCNQSIYGSRWPPSYDIGSIRVPMVFFHGGHDALADLKDYGNLKAVLPRDVVVEEHYYPEYTHMDFAWGIDAPERVYAPLLRKLKFMYGDKIGGEMSSVATSSA